jgi:hypothetical protein
VDAGTALEAACRIIIIGDQLEEALRIDTELRRGQTHSTEGVRGPVGLGNGSVQSTALSHFRW